MSQNSLPTFLIIGASKCGTTSLASYLEAHPQVEMAKPKELNFFSFHWHEGLAAYQARFRDMSAKIRGEASTSYTRAPLVPGVPERIASVIPHVRILYLVRNPIERMRSEYVDQVHGGRETAPTLAEALATNPRYLNVSRYGYQLDLYRQFFPDDQLMVLSSERLKSDRIATVRKVLEFLGADPEILPRNLHHEFNTRDEKLRIPPVLDAIRALWRRARPLTGRFPRRWRGRLHALLGSTIDPTVIELSPEQEKDLWDQLSTDIARLRQIAGPQAVLWP